MQFCSDIEKHIWIVVGKFAQWILIKGEAKSMAVKQEEADNNNVTIIMHFKEK